VARQICCPWESQKLITFLRLLLFFLSRSDAPSASPFSAVRRRLQPRAAHARPGDRSTTCLVFDLFPCTWRPRKNLRDAGCIDKEQANKPSRSFLARRRSFQFTIPLAKTKKKPAVTDKSPTPFRLLHSTGPPQLAELDAGTQLPFPFASRRPLYY
jgi:hypothetical protein